MTFRSMSRDYMAAKKHIVPLNPEDEENIEGKIIIITGANSGIGKSTAAELAHRNGIVIMACRNLEKAQKALMDIRKNKTSKGQLIPMEIDLGDLKSIRNFVQEFTKKFTHLNILICNGGMAEKNPKLFKTKDGFESHMGVNHLGHFLLTNLLLDHLKLGQPSRVVSVASTIYHIANLNLDDLNMEKFKGSFGWGNYLPYANSKYANLLFIKELGERLQLNENTRDIKAYGLCPGMVRTEFFRKDSWLKQQVNKLTLGLIGFSPDEACQTVLFCTLSKNISNETGKMYRFGHSWPEVESSLPKEKCLKLWEISEKLVGLEKDHLLTNDSQQSYNWKSKL